MVEQLIHKGVNGVFIPEEEWDKILFLTKKKDNLLAKLVRSVKE